jgi:gliding motility-associated lipoprotein GldH
MEAHGQLNPMKRLSHALNPFSSIAGIVFLLAGLATLPSCSDHWAEEEVAFERGCWAKGDTVTLTFESTDTSRVYQLSFPIQVNEDYPFHNIYLHAILTAPSGDASLLEDEFILADRTGTWLSEPSGDVVNFQLNMADGLRFNQTGTYRIQLFHYMRQEDLCGVEEAGIVVDAVE